MDAEVDAKLVQVCALFMLFILHQILKVYLASESFLCSCQILAEDLASRLSNLLLPYKRSLYLSCLQIFSIFQFCREIETSTKKEEDY